MFRRGRFTHIHIDPPSRVLFSTHMPPSHPEVGRGGMACARCKAGDGGFMPVCPRYIVSPEGFSLTKHQEAAITQATTTNSPSTFFIVCSLHFQPEFPQLLFGVNKPHKKCLQPRWPSSRKHLQEDKPLGAPLITAFRQLMWLRRIVIELPPLCQA